MSDGEELTPLDLYAEQIADDVTNAFNAWIRPEMAKVIGWPAVNGIKDMDFESVLAAQNKGLFLKTGRTHKKRGMILTFKFCQGIDVKGKFTVLSKLAYEVDFDTYKEKDAQH